MDKLISANSLLKKLSTNSKGERIPEYDVDNFPVTLTLREIKNIIRDEPVAFNKEKVIDIISRANSAITMGNTERALYFMKILEEIVEKGGVE